MHKTETEEDKNVEKLIEELPRNHFTDTDLQIAWQKFIQELQQKDILIYNAINSFKLKKKEEDIIEITYSSDFAKGEFCLLYTSRCV